jgi:hypothetical protein
MGRKTGLLALRTTLERGKPVGVKPMDLEGKAQGSH